MKIVLTSQREVASEKGARRDALEQDYIEYYSTLGFLLVPVSNQIPDPRAYFLNLPVFGILLTGGNSVCPATFGSARSALSDCSPARDRTEKVLLSEAIARDLPVFAECRGLQFLNAYFDGSICECISEENAHIAREHEIDFCDSALVDFLGATTSSVNSYHSQGISDAERAPTLEVFARARDGSIEGLYHPRLPIAGIMWHPERESPDPQMNQKILDAFAERRLYWRKKQ